MRVIVAANGNHSRWDGYLGVRKQELVVDGEPLLGRTIRLLREHGVADILVTGLWPQYGVPWVIPRAEADLIDGRLSTREWWDRTGRTVVLMGDVFYSAPAMATILGHEKRDQHLFARFGPSDLTGKERAELFANSYWPEHHDAHEASLRAVIALYQAGRLVRTGLWEAYLYDHGHLHDGYIGPDNPYTAIRDCGDSTVIDDWTEDFDWPADWDAFSERYQGVAV